MSITARSCRVPRRTSHGHIPSIRRSSRTSAISASSCRRSACRRTPCLTPRCNRRRASAPVLRLTVWQNLLISDVANEKAGQRTGNDHRTGAGLARLTVARRTRGVHRQHWLRSSPPATPSSMRRTCRLARTAHRNRPAAQHPSHLAAIAPARSTTSLTSGLLATKIEQGDEMLEGYDLPDWWRCQRSASTRPPGPQECAIRRSAPDDPVAAHRLDAAAQWRRRLRPGPRVIPTTPWQRSPRFSPSPCGRGRGGGAEQGPRQTCSHHPCCHERHRPTPPADPRQRALLPSAARLAERFPRRPVWRRCTDPHVGGNLTPSRTARMKTSPGTIRFWNCPNASRWRKGSHCGSALWRRWAELECGQCGYMCQTYARQR